MTAFPTDLVIKGVTRAGHAFRPSDWSERLCGAVQAFGRERHKVLAQYVRAAEIDGAKAVIVGEALRGIESRLYDFLLNFAFENELQVTYQADAAASLLPQRPGAPG